MQQACLPVPKSQSASSPSMPAPRGLVSGKTKAIPSVAASLKNPPFCALIWAPSTPIQSRSHDCSPVVFGAC